MLQKIQGARRIRYKDEELYVILKGNAQGVFPRVYGLDDHENDTIVIINGADENKHGVCASSDELQDEKIAIMASFDENQPPSGEQRTWEPYFFSPLHITLAELAVVYSGISEDDHLKFLKRTTAPKEVSFLEYVAVSTAANQHLVARAAINLFYNGLSDYAEADNDTYKETQFFSEWGTGEEGPELLGEHGKQCAPKPSCLGQVQQDIVYVLQAVENPDWQDVPYIKLIAENDNLQI